MGEMASLWGYDESNDMEQLGQKLLWTTLELEKLKAEAMEEIKKNKQYVKQLIQLLKCAILERDEARNQFHKLLNKTMPGASIPLFQPGKANSSITESNSLSETYNYHSHGSSPVDSLLDPVSSPEFSNINLAVNQPVDNDSLIIDSLAKGRVLPQNGNFLQAVLQAGPLLQTLLVAGPLPRWRNPPQFQPLQIPPVTIRGCEADLFCNKTTSNVGQLSYDQFGQVISGAAPMLNFASLGSSGMISNGYAPLAKRQRFN